MSESDYPRMPQELDQAEQELAAARKKVNELRKQIEKRPVNDYVIKDLSGRDVSLSSLFGDKDDLILVHNMGKRCSYCTMWADGLIGIKDHLSDRAAFVVVSYDDPETARQFGASRNWSFLLYSNGGSSFFKDMGFESPKGDPWPGVSTFHREPDGTIKRISYSYFGPGDDFCSVWHFFDLLQDGPNDWSPKYKY